MASPPTAEEAGNRKRLPVRSTTMTNFPTRDLMRPVEGGAWIAANAIVTGDVTLGDNAGIWFSCVLRGDDAAIVIGSRTNVQDLTMIHADPGVPNVIGEDVTIARIRPNAGLRQEEHGERR